MSEVVQHGVFRHCRPGVLQHHQDLLLRVLRRGGVRRQSVVGRMQKDRVEESGKMESGKTVLILLGLYIYNVTCIKIKADSIVGCYSLTEVIYYEITDHIPLDSRRDNVVEMRANWKSKGR